MEHDAKKQRIVVKIGTSLLTETGGGLSREKLKRHVAAVAAACCAGHELVVVTSGAITAGFEKLGYQSKPKAIEAKQACAAVGQSLLIQAYSDAFTEYGLTVAQVLLTRKDFAVRESYNNALNTFNLLIEKRAIPIINENDTVAVKEINFGDNDILGALVATLLHADILIIFSDTDGLYDSDPSKNPQAKPIRRVEEITPEILAAADVPASRVGTGGMKAKIKAADFALSLGVQVFIGDGKIESENKILDVLVGEGHGTYFGNPRSTPVKRKRQWIVYHSIVHGQIVVDAGAVRALIEGGRSLLPVGVKEVRGGFKGNDVVEVLSQDGEVIGKGIVNYAASDLLQVMGRSSDFVKEELAHSRVEVIHRDNWVCLADEE